jgi:hypothetical protein
MVLATLVHQDGRAASHVSVPGRGATALPNEGVEAELVDLGSVSLDDLAGFDGRAFGPALEILLQRVDDPSSSISGYNPQRLD